MNPNPKLPDKVKKDEPVDHRTINGLIDAAADLYRRVRTLKIRPSIDIGIKSADFSGQTLYLKRRGGSSGSSSCPFGEIITWDTGSGESIVHHAAIAGGIVFCGDQTWNIDPQELDLSTDGAWLVSIPVTAEVNRDDDNELLLPNVKTGTEPSDTWTKTAWTTGTDYPDGTNPVVSTGEGVVILPIGKLIITDGVPALERAGCGQFRIQHCAGTLSFTRE